jgi:hypothetical protein
MNNIYYFNYYADSANSAISANSEKGKQ